MVSPECQTHLHHHLPLLLHHHNQDHRAGKTNRNVKHIKNNLMIIDVINSWI
jgi:hypothetical protein